ncbi:cysteine synthase B [Phanerochaete sordida]|uniref:Cysteine synthase B n=1 Tax=Phanerochaete sordida TaxID=48140 RepID=A0A9P3GB52_9APHY|nr:cysteine synthase B [Phanerochaete sordida]
MEPQLNVFTGPSAIRDFYNPEKNPPLPLVEIPEHPFVGDGVRIFAKLMTQLPAANVKSLPALNMLLRGCESGAIDARTERIVEYSSGNTVISLGILSRVLGLAPVTAYISNKTSAVKLQLLRFFGLEVSLFGGPAQVEPADVNGGIHAAIEDGKAPGVFNPGQYHNHHNSEAHVRWTGPQLLAQLPQLSVFAAAVGTSGTMTGTGSYFKAVSPRTVNLGIFTAPGDRVPGPRPIDLVQTVDLPWKEVIDDAEYVGSRAAYTRSLALCRAGLLVGPSSGLALEGLLQYLQKAKDARTLDALRTADGSVTCAFICCDQPFVYLGDYFDKVPAELFPPVHKEQLLKVDTYPYGVDWRLTPADAPRLLEALPTPCADGAGAAPVVLLDLRAPGDSLAAQPRAGGLPVVGLAVEARGAANPFRDADVLERAWTALNTRLAPSDEQFRGLFGDARKRVLVLSYDGTVASVACSVLRAKGAEAFWLDGRPEELGCL